MFIFFYISYMFMMSLIMLSLGIYLYMINKMYVFEWLIVSMNSMNLEFLLLIDWMSCLFVSVVLVISSMILIYSLIYMENEMYLVRFNYLVILFIFSMILMIFSPNVVSILFGWDGLGLVSFCLVVYYQNYCSFNSGMLTVLVNRFGDIMILMVIGLMMIYGSWNIFLMKKIKLLMVMLVIAGMTKSAQIPFSSWLPMAMAAPTPVSALVHSSTLVTAGVYLIIRFSKFLMEEEVSKMLMFFSVLTMFMSGLMANFEYDLKKIIALSTLSQLGLMMMILSLGFSLLSFYHLLTHAIFKSLLFMSAGAIIHLMGNSQDIRYMGSMVEVNPFMMYSFQVTVVALFGFPFFSGFYSKDLIMELVYFSKFNFMMFMFSLVSLSLTVTYSMRLMYYMFFSMKKSMSSVSWMYESGMMCNSMILLIYMSIFMGSFLNWLFFFDQSYFLPFYMKTLTLDMILLGVILFFIYKFMELMNLYFLSYFFSSMWFMNYVVKLINKPILMLGELFFFSDKVWMEYFSEMFFFQMVCEFQNFIMNNLYKLILFIFWLMVMLMVFY